MTTYTIMRNRQRRSRKQGSRRRMTPLERGLVVAARREGKTWDFIAEALYREPRTLKAAYKKAVANGSI